MSQEKSVAFPISALVLAMVLVLGVGSCIRFQRKDVSFSAPKKDFVKVGDRKIHVKDRGPKSPKDTVVFIHGFASSWVVWAGVMKEVGKRYRVVALDLPGFGYSDKRKGDYSPEALADVVSGLMKKKGIQKAHVVAHSWGCSVALALALRHKERVRSLTLMSAWVFEGQMVPFLVWSRVPVLGEVLFTLFYRERVGDRYAMAFFEPERYTDFRTVGLIKKALRRPGAVRASLQAVRQMRFEKLQKSYSNIEVPTLLIWGKQDHVAKETFAHKLQRELSKSRLRVLHRCGHFPMIERPHVTLRELRRHLAKWEAKKPVGLVGDGQDTKPSSAREPAPTAAPPIKTTPGRGGSREAVRGGTP